ncbi:MULTISPECIES: HAMP domain-containing sensor histidine kinase [unclassified Amycolatopsis]|uniref:sensor histidine kinase n=1 Tax=unclassified Amycolatopsis TaxID=2618356 RepID=UPI0023AFD141|nr:HAMP domain-containing sensor histidine kinase [Amycolatopsis sp. La24]
MFLGGLLVALVLAYPVGKGVSMVLGTYVDTSFCPRGTACRNPLGTILWFLPLALVVILAIRSWRPVVSWVVRPLLDLSSTIDQLGPRNLGQRMPPHQTERELRVLSTAVNGMLDRVAAGFEGQRRFAANASHELRTPLAVQRTLAEVAIVTGGGEDVRRLAAQLLVVNERNEQLIEGLLVLAEADRGLPGMVPVRLDELVDAVVTRYGDQLTEHELTLRHHSAERTVPGDPVLLERMIANLVHNAIKYNRPGGWVEVNVGGEPALSVRNSGDRVPAEAVDSLFQPFRRLTDERLNHRDGAGLGLSIVNSVATAHRGRVSAVAVPDGGLRVDVVLP